MAKILASKFIVFLILSIFLTACAPASDLRENTRLTQDAAVTVIEKIVTVIVTTTPGPTSTGVDGPNTASAGVDEPIVSTSTITPELVLSSTPEVELVSTGETFVDDFEIGPDPLWGIQYGQPGMANGKFTALAPYEDNKQTDHLVLLNRMVWENFRVTFELAPFNDTIFPSSDARLIVLLRYAGNDSPSPALLIYPGDDGLEFGYYDNGEWQPLSSSHVEMEDLANQSSLITIEVIDDTFRAFINNHQVTSITIANADSGQVGLWFRTGSVRNEPEYFSPRIETLTVEALP